MQTINDLEESAQAGLESLRDINQNNDLSSALELFLPDGLTPVVELIDENGRRKRGTAASWNWNPQTDKVRISFKPATSSSRTHSMRGANSPSQPAATNAASLSDSSQAEGSLQAESSSSQLPGSSNLSSSVESVTPQEIIECCQAVASAERSNRQFIALKWFRDDFLSTVDYAWARQPQRRQRVLSTAIEMGRIETRKIPNPRSPQFPTTTISLNRLVPTPGVPSRFQPIKVRGESVSSTLLRDRGTA